MPYKLPYQFPISVPLFLPGAVHQAGREAGRGDPGRKGEKYTAATHTNITFTSATPHILPYLWSLKEAPSFNCHKLPCIVFVDVQS